MIFRNKNSSVMIKSMKMVKSLSLRWMSSVSDGVKEAKIDVNGVGINHVIVGNGKHPVLLLPGAMGSIWTDFKPQIEGLDREKLTIVGWDPPGYGKSRPYNRTYPLDFFQRDAQFASDLMKKLGFNKYSLVGWSDGGITSIIIAANNPETINKMVLLAANSYITDGEAKIYESIKNIDTWSDRMKQPLIAIYGEEYLRKSWTAWVEGMINIYHKNNGDICKECVPRIKCPTLILQGSKDALVDQQHLQYFKNNIPNSRLEIIENGSHNLHFKYHKEFNQLVMDFILKDDK